MAVTPPASASGPGPYVRASAGGPIDARRVVRVLAVLGAAALAAVAVLTGVGAAHQNTVQTRLQRDGVPVELTVTGCAGVTSGIGQSVTYYACRGSYTFDGRRYDEAIGGSRGLHPTGQALPAVVVRSDPRVVATASSVARRFSTWTPYVTPAILAAAALLTLLSLRFLPRPRRGDPPGA